MLKERLWLDNKKNKKMHFWQPWRAVSPLQMFPQTPPCFSPGSSTVTHSVFTAAGGLPAVLTHITWVKRPRSHIEVQRFMAANIKMLSESRNCSPLWWSRVRYHGWSLQRLNSIKPSGVVCGYLHIWCFGKHHCVKSKRFKFHSFALLHFFIWHFFGYFYFYSLSLLIQLFHF